MAKTDRMKLPGWAMCLAVPAAAKLIYGILISRECGATRPQIAKALKISERSVRRHLKALESSGMVTKADSGVIQARPNRRYGVQAVNGIQLPSGSLVAIAAREGVSRSLVYRVARGTKKSARIRRQIEALAERVRRAG